MKKFIILLISVMLISTSITAAYVTYAASIRDTSEIIKTQEEIALISSEKKELAAVPKAPSITADIIDTPLSLEREVAGMVISVNHQTNEIIIKLIDSGELYSFFEEEGANDWEEYDGAIITLSDNGTDELEDDIVVDSRYESDYNYYIPISEEEWNKYHSPSIIPATQANTTQLLSELIWNEGRGTSRTNQAEIVWVVLNRVNDPRFPNTIESVLTQKVNGVEQFSGFLSKGIAHTDFEWLAWDILRRYHNGEEGLVPSRFLYWYGSKSQNRNIPRTSWDGGETWPSSPNSPYQKGRKMDLIQLKALFIDVKSHALYQCEKAMPELRKLSPIVQAFNKDTELTIKDREVLLRLLNVFKIVNDDLVKRWSAEDPEYKWSDAAKLHRRLEVAITSIEIITEE